jgi:hypothetical protein
MNLTEHFTFEELTYSDTAYSRKIDNNPVTQEHAANLKRLASMLEEIRLLLGNHPIIVTSGYRSPKLNAAVGGVANSAHLTGLAADFICPAFGGPQDVCKALQPHIESLGIDQLILERFGNSVWVHLGLTAGRPRGMAFTMTPGGNLDGFA